MAVPIEIIAHVASFMPIADHLTSSIPALYRTPLEMLQRMSVTIAEMILHDPDMICEFSSIGEHHPFPDRIAVNALMSEGVDSIKGLAKNGNWTNKSSPEYVRIHFLADYWQTWDGDTQGDYPWDDTMHAALTYDVVSEFFLVYHMYRR